MHKDQLLLLKCVTISLFESGDEFITSALETNTIKRDHSRQYFSISTVFE